MGRAKRPPPPRFKVGDWPVWKAGNSRNVVQIIEDVGPVGHAGRRFYGFRRYDWTDLSSESGKPEDCLEPATPEDLAKLPPGVLK